MMAAECNKKRKKGKRKSWCLGEEMALESKGRTRGTFVSYHSLFIARDKAFTEAMHELADPVTPAMPARNSHQLYPINISFSYVKFPYTPLQTVEKFWLPYKK